MSLTPYDGESPDRRTQTQEEYDDNAEYFARRFAEFPEEFNAEIATLAAATAGFTRATTSTSVTLSPGSKAVTLNETGKIFPLGAWARIASAADPTKAATGYVTVASGTALTVVVTNFTGSGSFSDGVISVTGEPASLARGHLAGLGLSNNATDATNDIDIAAGSARDSTNAADIVLAAALTKRLDAAWAVGTGNGGLDTGAIANGTYHVWLIKRSDTGVVDALFSASATAPTMPTGYDYKRRIGSVLRESAAIAAFIQRGDTFLRSVPSALAAVANPGTAAVLHTLAIPTGLIVDAIFSLVANGGGGSNAYALLVTSPDQPDTAPSTTLMSLRCTATAPGGGEYRHATNTSAQIRTRQTASGVSDTLNLTAMGWVDHRGRDD